MGADFWRSVGGAFQQVPGRAANVAGLGVDALTTLNALASRDPTALLQLQAAQAQALQDPTLRARAVESPFFGGLLGGVAHSQPGLPVPGPAGPTRLAVNLPPLSASTQADQALQRAENELIQANPQAAARAALRIPPAISEIAPGANLTLQRIGPSGPTYGVLPPPQPLQPTNIPGLVRDPTTNRIVRDPTSGTGTAGQQYLTQARQLDPRRLAGIASGVTKPSDLTQQQAQTILAQQRQQAVDQAAERARATEAVKQQALTSPTRTMLEAAPSVIGFVSRIEKDLTKVQVGPFAGRWQELWARRVGVSDPDFIRLRTDMDLLSTLLLRMHVGARGGNQILAHFQALLGEGQQSPENLRAALGAIRDYASALEVEHHRGPLGGQMAPPKAGEEIAPGVKYLGPVQ